MKTGPDTKVSSVHARGTFLRVVWLLVMVSLSGCFPYDTMDPEGYLVLRELKFRRDNRDVRLPVVRSRADLSNHLNACTLLEDETLAVILSSRAELKYHIGDYFRGDVQAAFHIRNTGASTLDIPLTDSKLVEPGGLREHRAAFIGDDGSGDDASVVAETSGNDAIAFYDPSPFDVMYTSRPTVYRRSKGIRSIAPGTGLNVLLTFHSVPARLEMLEVVVPIMVDSGVDEVVFVLEKWDYSRACEKKFDKTGKAFLLTSEDH